MKTRFAIHHSVASGTIALLLLAAACGSPDSNSDANPFPTAAGGTMGSVGGSPGTAGSSGGTVAPTSGGSESPPAASGGGDGIATGGAAPGGMANTGGAPAGGAPPVAGAGSPTAGGPTAPKPAPTLIGDVAFSVPSQSFKTELGVSLSTVIADAEIRYTTDGTVPTASSTLYPGAALQLTATTQVRAQAFVGGMPAGALSTALYIARTFDLSSTLPIILVDGYGKGKPSDKEVSLDAAVMIFEPSGGMASPHRVADAGVAGGLPRARAVFGQLSADALQDRALGQRQSRRRPPRARNAVRLRLGADPAVLRPRARSAIRSSTPSGTEMGIEAPRNAYAEVYINYEARPVADSDYQGIYWFRRRSRTTSDRTNLKQLKEADTMLPHDQRRLHLQVRSARRRGTEAALHRIGPAVEQLRRPGSRRWPRRQRRRRTDGTCWVDLEVVDPEPLNARTAKLGSPNTSRSSTTRCTRRRSGTTRSASTCPRSSTT